MAASTTEAEVIRNKLDDINKCLSLTGAVLERIALLLFQNKVINETNYRAAVERPRGTQPAAAELILVLIQKFNYEPECFQTFINSLETTELTHLADDLNAELKRRKNGNGGTPEPRPPNPRYSRARILAWATGAIGIILPIVISFIYSNRTGFPQIVNWVQHEYTIIDAHEITFMCEAVATPEHSVVWMFNNSVIITTNDTSDKAKYSINGDRSNPKQFGSLTVSNVQYSDHGVYQCIAVNHIGNVSESLTLTVHATPVVHKVISPLTADINTTTNLYCVATGYPRPIISWLKDGVNISLSEMVQASTLSVTDVLKQSVVLLPNGVSVPVDSALSEVLAHDDILSELGSIGLLMFNGLVREDTANYTCVATNTLPLTETLHDQSVSTSLTVQEQPSPPFAVTVVRNTGRSVYLEWKPQFDGRLTILGYNIYQNDLDRKIMDQPVKKPLQESYTTVQPMFYVDSGIIPYTVYTFAVEACNLLGCSDRNVSAPITTDIDAPDSPPMNCLVSAISSTALNTTWLVPAEPNGLIDHYRVSYTAVHSYSGINYTTATTTSATTPDNSTQLVLNQLLKGTSYSITLIAYTAVGPSPPSTDHCIAYTLEDIPDGPPRDVAAYSDTSSSIIIKWAPPELSLQNGAITYYYITYTSVESDQQQLTINTTELQIQITDLHVFTDYNITVASATAIGIGPFTSTIAKTLNETSEAPVDVNSTYNPCNGTITVQWSPPLVSNGIITSYRIYYTPSKPYEVSDPLYDTSERQSEVKSTTGVLSELYFDTKYIIMVTAINEAGEGARSVAKEQVVPISNDSKSIKVPPLALPPANSKGDLKLTIIITPPSSLNGLISHYQIIVVTLDQNTPVCDLLHPDIAFPTINAFSTYDTIVQTKLWGYAGYIAAEFSRDLFPSDGRFTVGDPTETANDRKDWYPNNPLQYGSRYTFFLRVYPLINTTKRSAVRQYHTFSSSEYTARAFQTSPNLWPAAIGSAIAIAVGIAVLVFAVYCLWRKCCCCRCKRNN